MPRRAPFPVRGLFGIHRGKILPSSDTRERITSTYRHRQALGNAFRGHLAVAERPRAHCEHTLLCAGLRGIQFAGICRHARPPDDAPRQHIVSKATLRLRKGQHARSHRTPPEPIREMRRCPAAAVGTAAMKELGHRRAAYWGGGRDIDTHGLPGARGPSAAGSQPAEAWSRLERGTYWDAGVRLQLGRAYAPPRCPPTRRAGAAAGMHCVGTEPSASRAPSVERGGIRPRAFAGAGQCRRLRAIPASGPTALQEHQ